VVTLVDSLMINDSGHKVSEGCCHSVMLLQRLLLPSYTSERGGEFIFEHNTARAHTTLEEIKRFAGSFARQ